MSEKTVFISYRRNATGNAFARLVHGRLTNHGYDSFIDVENLVAGKWEEQLRTQVPQRAHFLLLLTPGSLDDCSDPKDWVRQEFELAVMTKRNIVVVREESVNLKSLQQNCPDAMQAIFTFQIVELRHTGFDADFDRLIRDFIPPHKAPPHPAHAPATSIPNHSAELAFVLSKSKSPSVLVDRILDMTLLLAFMFTLLQGMNDDWSAALLIPITICLKGFWLIPSLSSEVKIIAFAALIALVCGSTILAGSLRLKKDLRGAWGIAGWILLALGVGAAAAVAIIQSVRSGKSGNAGT